MRSNKGQALVEFIIILPVTLILIFCIIDFGRVITLKSELEGKTEDAVTLYENGKSLEEINAAIIDKKDDIKISLKETGEYVTIDVSKKIKPITPGLSYIAKNVFDVNVSRVIRNE